MYVNLMDECYKITVIDASRSRDEQEELTNGEFTRRVECINDCRRGNFTSMTMLFGKLSIAHQRLLTKEGSLATPDWESEDSKSEELLDVLSDLLFDLAIFVKLYDINLTHLISTKRFDESVSLIRDNNDEYGSFESMMALFGELSVRHRLASIGDNSKESLNTNVREYRFLKLYDALSDLLYDVAIFAQKHDMTLISAISNKVENVDSYESYSN